MPTPPSRDAAGPGRALTTAASGAARASWTRPRLDELPRLTELTLQTGGFIPGGGGSGGGGSTVF